MWNVITGNHAPARFRALATLDKRCVVFWVRVVDCAYLLIVFVGMDLLANYVA
jgi:hypothetical protein